MSSKTNFRLLLLPFSWLYGFVVMCRNLLFEVGVLQSKSFGLPVISVGNITVGGTGKTPHTEYLATLLSKEFQVAILSRGYKRSTKGFHIAGTESGLSVIGDEPMQMKRKFPGLVVAVDENRRRAIKLLSDETINPRIDVILLDDAYQHRYVKPAISILLIDFNRLINEDHLLPAGNLREPASQAKRANFIIISKCPAKLKPIELRILSKNFDLYPQQSIFFTTLVYGPLRQMSTIFSDSLSANTENSQKAEAVEQLEKEPLSSLETIREKKIPVLIIAGTASPDSFVNHILSYCPDAHSMLYPDHHNFSRKDYVHIKHQFEKIRLNRGIIITTEKDSMRILENGSFREISGFIYYPEIKISFLGDQGSTFNNKILDYVRINKRNR